MGGLGGGFRGEGQLLNCPFVILPGYSRIPESPSVLWLLHKCPQARCLEVSREAGLQEVPSRARPGYWAGWASHPCCRSVTGAG